MGAQRPLFARKEKPLPQPVLEPAPPPTSPPDSGGIHLGGGCYWNPADLPNGHLVAIGASGSGKTQTLKAIAYELHRTYPQMQVLLLDFHGDQQVEGEACYPLHATSPYGINPLTVNLDPEGGGPNLQAIQVAKILKKSLRLGPNQEGLILEVIKACYHQRGISQEREDTWSREPPNFDDLEEELNRRSATLLKDERLKELAEGLELDSLPVGKPNASGLYFIFHQGKLAYIGAARDIQQRFDGHHHIRTLMERQYPSEQEKLEFRYWLQPGDWQQLVRLENYLLQIHQPLLNQTQLRVECRESQKLRLKLAATFQYGVFSRPQPPLTEKLARLDLSKLPPSLAAIAAESMAHQVMDRHRLLGEISGKLPRTYLFIDEAKEMSRQEGAACDRAIADGRKYGLALVLASQSERHLSKDVIGNSASKIVLPVDQTEVKKAAAKFRFAEKKVAELVPLTALCRFGKQARLVEIEPYYLRIQKSKVKIQNG